MAIDFKMSHLTEGVHTGIGTAGTEKLEFCLPENLLAGVEKRPLNGPLAFLHLPSGVAASVVFNSKFESHFVISYMPTACTVRP